MRPFRASILAMLLVSACGAVPGQTDLSLPTPPTAALARWTDFPANANPRPVILFNPIAEQVGGNKFPDNDSKLAWLCNKFVLASGLDLTSTGPAVAPARWPSGVTASYPSIGSGRAYAAIMARAPGGNSADCAPLKPFVITGVRWATAGFPTDRGTATLSAWLFDVPAANGYVGYSGLDPSAYWGGRTVDNGGSVGGRLSADGRTVTIGLVGPPETGSCGADYTAAAAESETAVAVAVKMIPHAPPDQPVNCDLVGYARSVAVTLKAPLGGRVLLDENGNVGSVCPENGDC